MALACAASAATLLLGLDACTRGGATRPRGPVADRPAPPASAFPSANGRTLGQLVHAAGARRSNLIVSPTGTVYEPGQNRFGFGVVTVSRAQIPAARVALYTAPSSGGHALGPFPARVESLRVSPRFASRTTRRDPDAARSVYVAHVTFPRDGRWSVVALFHRGDGYAVSAAPPTVSVGSDPSIPDVGDRAPAIHTPTAADVNGRLSRIDTRKPPDDMHRVDFADSLGRQPIVLLFATPALCQSRVCGPVVDIADEVEHETAGRVAFIHQEVYRGNNPTNGVRPQLRAFGLRTEPWLFVLDRRGIVRTRIEGAFDAAELERAVRRVAR